MNRTKVTDPSYFEVAIRSSVPAHFKGDITVSFWNNGKKIPVGAEIDLVAFYLVPSDHELARYGIELAEDRVDNSSMTGPQKAILIGKVVIYQT